MEREPRQRETTSESSPEKTELLQLEAEGKYVFHGTGADVEMLEPRQSVDTQTGPDGNPAVFASDLADYAIFMAVINKRNFPGGIRSRVSRYGHEDGSHEYVYYVPVGALKRLDESATGWVYVYTKEQFKPYIKAGEFISEVPVTPVRKVLVHRRDLPIHIETFE